MESLLVGMVALAACYPLWRGGPRGVGPLALAGLLTLFAVGVAILSWVWSPRPKAPPATRPLEVLGAGYAGSASCRSCHPEQHATWRESFHATMTQVAQRDTLVPQFDRLQLDWLGKPVGLEWRGDTLWVEFERAGNQPGHVRRPVEQLTGSHHLQVLWYSTGAGRQLAPVPMCYKIAEATWLPLTAVFVLPPEFRDPPEPGAWNENCHMCHATNVRPRVDVDRCDTQLSELGIACEACHGPGAEHVTRNHDPWRRYGLHLGGGADPSIVQPQRLPKARAAEVCGQCHSVNILREQHFAAWREEGLVYRPGQDLAATNLILGKDQQDAPELARTRRQNPHFLTSVFWSDGQVRVTGREYNGLLQSPCYTHGVGDRQLDCASCHELHRDPATDRDLWRDDQLRPGHRGNQACTQCHEALRQPAQLVAHTHHGAGSTGSVCYDCHMPHTTFGLMKATRSHTITSPSVRVELETGRPNACNLCHLDRSLQWTNEHLQAFYGVAPAPLDAEQQEVAASVRWLLSGDAGQRALAAASYGRREAQAAAGADWLAPYLARLLDDPYYVVRFVAARSLRALPDGAPGLDGYDFLAPAGAARGYGQSVEARWQAGYRGAARPAVLLDGSGGMGAAFARLYARRDDRPVFLAE